MSMPSWTSPRASSRTLPISAVMARASRSLCCARSAPKAYRISPRRGAGVRRHPSPASRAARMAAAMSDASDAANVPMTPCGHRPGRATRRSSPSSPRATRRRSGCRGRLPARSSPDRRRCDAAVHAPCPVCSSTVTDDPLRPQAPHSPAAPARSCRHRSCAPSPASDRRRGGHQDWEEADRLRALIEAQGWKVVDKGAEGRVVRAHPEDVIEDGRRRSDTAGPAPCPTSTATAMPGTGHHRRACHTRPASDTVRLVSRLTDAPAGTHLLIVADESARTPRRTSADAEVIRIVAPHRRASLLAVALRRARSDIIVVGEGWPAEATADRIPALVDAAGRPDGRRRGLVGPRLVRPAPPVRRPTPPPAIR